MIVALSADEFNKRQKIDPVKVEADKKKKADEAKKKRVAEAEKKPGYLKPSGHLDKASK